MKQMVVWSGGWWGEKRDRVIEHWNEWMLKKQDLGSVSGLPVARKEI